MLTAIKNRTEKEQIEATAKIRMTLGEFIRNRRLERGLLQTEVAKIANLSPSLISSIESGVTPNPSIQTMSAIGKALRFEKDLWDFISKRSRN